LGHFKDGEKGVRDIQTIAKNAMEKTGLSDFGGAEFMENYSNMFNTPSHKKSQFSNLGYIGAKIEMGLSLERRLKLVQYIKDYPEVLKIPVRTPLFVMGLPRTGTTFLHRLLSLDPDTRAPLMWELLDPIPLCGGDSATNNDFTNDRNKRCQKVKDMLDQRKSMGDDALKHIHEIEHDLAEECILCLADEIPLQMNNLMDVYLNVDKFLKADAFKAYAYYKKVLQILSYQQMQAQDPQRWVLKCPIHIFYVNEIAKIFPDAKIVWTHRHPVSAVPSMCSLIKAFNSVYFEPESINQADVGTSVRDVSAFALEKATQDLQNSNLQHADVIYSDLIKNPLAIIKSIYKNFGWEVSPQYEQNILNYLEENKRERDRLKAKKSSEQLHNYGPEDFALTSAELCEGKFADYIKKYKLPMDKN
jgi:hypothetical protein